jgi:uncharacterized protein YbbK (DUF523 family)
VLTNKSGHDLTDTMRQFARRRIEAFAGDELCGFVLKKDSPTCDLERVKVYGATQSRVIRIETKVASSSPTRRAIS